MWQNDTYIKPLSIVSAPGYNKPPLIDNSKVIYCFDDINKSLYRKNYPKSADGLFFYKNNAYFVEFKTGYKKKITKDNYCEEMAMCHVHKHPCSEHKELFFSLQKKETEELNHSIKLKAIESYITLEKQIIPCCEDNGKCQVKLLVVIDADDTDDYENTLLELAEKKTDNNIISSLENSLCNYKRKQDKSSLENDYFYDEIKVMSAEEFEQFFNSLPAEKITPSSLDRSPELTVLG